MKTIFRITFLVGVVVFLFGTNSGAVPFSSTGTVDPNYNNSWNEVFRTGIARIVLTIDEDWPQVNYVTLEFESDIFDFTGWDASDITVVNPTDWSTSVFSNVSGYEFSLSTDDTIATSPIVIDVAYTLLDSAMYDDAAGAGWSWDEGQAWALTYTMGDSTASYVTSGGSTDPVSNAPVPEPTTMLLVGCGLAGLATLRRKKVF